MASSVNSPRRLVAQVWIAITMVVGALIGCGNLLATCSLADSGYPGADHSTVITVSAWPPTAEGGDAAATTTAAGSLIVTTPGTRAVYTLVRVQRSPAADVNGARAGDGVWLLAHLRVEVDTGSWYVSSTDLALVAADGQVHDAAITAVPGYPGIPAGDVGRGQHTDGWDVFDAPASLTGARIQLRASSGSGYRYGYWQL